MGDMGMGYGGRGTGVWDMREMGMGVWYMEDRGMGIGIYGWV